MHIEAAQAQYTHRVTDAPVHGQDRNFTDHGSKRQLHRNHATPAVHEENGKERRREERASARAGDGDKG